MQNNHLTLYTKTYSDMPLLHLFEHVMVARVTDALERRRFYPVIHYSLEARTRYSTALIQLETLSEMVKEITLQTLTQKTPPLAVSELSTALAECSCEFQSVITSSIPEQSTLKQLEELRVSAWVQEADEPVATKKLHHRASIIKSSDFKPRKFCEYKLNYILPVSMSYGGDISPLSVVIIQALAMRLINSLTQQYDCYDIGDDWGLSQVKYHHTLRFVRTNAPSKGAIKQTVDKNFKAIKNDGFNEIIYEAFNKDDCLAATYFTPMRLFDLTGVVIKDFKIIATKDNIAEIVNKLDITVK